MVFKWWYSRPVSSFHKSLLFYFYFTLSLTASDDILNKTEDNPWQDSSEAQNDCSSAGAILADQLITFPLERQTQPHHVPANVSLHYIAANIPVHWVKFPQLSASLAADCIYLFLLPLFKQQLICRAMILTEIFIISPFWNLFSTLVLEWVFWKYLISTVSIPPFHCKRKTIKNGPPRIF